MKLFCLFLSFIFCSNVAISNELDEKCARYGYDYESFNGETEAILFSKASRSPTEENRCRLHNYVNEGMRKAEVFSKKLKQFSSEGKCSKYSCRNLSPETFSMLLEKAIQNPSEENVCLYHQYQQFAVEKASKFSESEECW